MSDEPLWARCDAVKSLTESERGEIAEHDLLLGHWDGKRWAYLWLGNATYDAVEGIMHFDDHPLHYCSPGGPTHYAFLHSVPVPLESVRTFELWGQNLSKLPPGLLGTVEATTFEEACRRWRTLAAELDPDDQRPLWPSREEAMKAFYSQPWWLKGPVKCS